PPTRTPNRPGTARRRWTWSRPSSDPAGRVPPGRPQPVETAGEDHTGVTRPTPVRNVGPPPSGRRRRGAANVGGQAGDDPAPHRRKGGLHGDLPTCAPAPGAPPRPRAARRRVQQRR